MIKIIFLIAWLVICLWVLSIPLLDIHNGEAHIFFGLVMMGITFPLGYIFAMLIAFIGFAIDKCCGLSLPNNEIMLIPLWLGFVFIGYFQWFKICPWLYRKIRGKLNAT